MFAIFEFSIQHVHQLKDKKHGNETQQRGVFTPVHQMCRHVKTKACQKAGKKSSCSRASLAFNEEIERKGQQRQHERTKDKHEVDDLDLKIKGYKGDH